ncbi:hypothetical protein MVEN_01231100 [Mycena venus]|uniref:Uncharacterized protein n=1 Tax=Mycena venus TaxID=2733690 RepID=A0A8H6Y6A2_9AGAR|nr:hypothetical protein MVEN_01231100 [Mycena venus]
MFSCLRARLRTTRPFAFSTTAAPRNEADFGGFGQLAGVLEEQAKLTPPLADKPKAQAQETNRPVHEYRPIQPNSFIRPYDLSLDGRSWKNRPSSRPPTGRALDARRAQAGRVLPAWDRPAQVRPTPRRPLAIYFRNGNDPSPTDDRAYHEESETHRKGYPEGKDDGCHPAPQQIS